MPLAQQWLRGNRGPAMATMAYRNSGLSVGRVLDRALSTIRYHPMPTLAVAVLFAGLPTAAADYLLRQMPWSYMVMTIGSMRLPGGFALFLAGWFVSLVLGSVAQGAMTRPAMTDSESRRASLVETLGAVARVLLPLVMLGVVIGAGVIIGTSLAIVPGMLIYVFWSVAPSAEAAERDGVFLALSRSQELGEGARWKILAIALILLGIYFVVAMLSGFLLFVLFQAGWASSTLSFILRAALDAVIAAFSGTVLASLYVELRDWKEGGSVEALERVFV